MLAVFFNVFSSYVGLCKIYDLCGLDISGSRYEIVVTSCERHNQLSAVTDISRSLVYLSCNFHLNLLLDGFSLACCIHQWVRYSKYIDLLYFPLWTQIKAKLALPFEKMPSVSDGPGSSVGIATGYGLDGPGIESRWG